MHPTTMDVRRYVNRKNKGDDYAKKFNVAVNRMERRRWGYRHTRALHLSRVMRQSKMTFIEVIN